MRLNKFIARATGKSRREADDLIEAGRVSINGEVAPIGFVIPDPLTSKQVRGHGSIQNPVNKENGFSAPEIKLDNQILRLPLERTLIMLNKPVGYVSSRRAQAKGARTLYELLPPKLRHLKTVGRLDKDSSGLILLTDDGDLAFQMTHPKFAKTKIYLVKLDKTLEPLHQQMISDFGVDLPDGKSRMTLEKLGYCPESLDRHCEPRAKQSIDCPGGKPPRNDEDQICWRVTMHEGRNRQIRRTFAALGYTVVELHRTNFGKYSLGDLPSGHWQNIDD